MNRQTMAVAAMALAMLLAAGGNTMGATDEAARNGRFNVLDFGARADGATDDTGAIQAAIGAAAERGGTVYLPPGEYLCAGNLRIAGGVALVGSHDAPVSIHERKGTILLPTAGRGDEDAPPFIYMEHATSVRGLTIYYPEQRTEDITPYPWTFQLNGHDQTVEDVTLINSYNGIRTGPENNVRHRIRSVAGCVLRRGVFVDACTDIGRVENVQWHAHWWTTAAFDGDSGPVYRFMADNLEAFVFARTDWEYITNNFVFPAYIGYRFIGGPHGESNGHMTACGADANNTAVQVDAIQFMGWLVTGGQFASFEGVSPTQVRIKPSCTGNMRFVNCTFWGHADHNAVVEGTGNVSFSDCYFSSWRDSDQDALVDVRSGRVQVQACTFGSMQPSVRLGPEVRHAIVRGNNGVAGVTVLNEAPRAIVADNEPDALDWSEAWRRHARVNIGADGDGLYLSGWHGGPAENRWADGTLRRWSADRSTVLWPVLPHTRYELAARVGVPETAVGEGSGIYVDGRRVVAFDEASEGVARGTFQSGEADKVHIEFRVKGWRPVDVIEGNPDERTLGVNVHWVELTAAGAEGEPLVDANTGRVIEAR